MLTGGMQDQPLLVTKLIDHAAREHGGREVITRWADGTVNRGNWASVHEDARKLSQALQRLGIGRGDRVATLAMNHVHHLVAWFGIAGMGGVCHTVNPRLFDDQIVYIVNHAADRVLLFDKVFQPIVERLRDQFKTVELFVLFDAEVEGDFASFRALVDAEDGDFEWVRLDERDPCGLCYTSGTTGNPKGVLFQHRSNVLHAYAQLQPDVFDLASRSVALPVVPMFHANAWGMPYACAAVGAKLVYSATNDAAGLWQLIREEGVTHTAGVPTVWMAMFADMDANGGDFAQLGTVLIGGSAAPAAMIERMMKAGVHVVHAWGMTETSPIGTVGRKPPEWEAMTFDERVAHVSKQGQVPFGVEVRTVDDGDRVLPRDGKTSGRLQVRGPWVVQRYFGAESDAVGADDWFDTGDVAVLHPDGTMQITDRAKDMIKSGGEWISSIELENAAMKCPGVAEAAAVGVPHPKWDERPLLLVVRKSGSKVSAEEVLSVLAGAVAKWWLPDEIKFVESLPHTATGKLLKRQLRDEYKDYRLGG